MNNIGNINAKSIYFIGIGGVSMSSLAHIALHQGKRVGGSDRTLSPVTARLAEQGAQIFEGHIPGRTAGYELVVYTAAVAADNPELEYSRAHGIPCVTRAEYLGQLMLAYKRRIGVAGTHGKSTTSLMLSKILLDAGADPTLVIGAELPSLGASYRCGGVENFVFEACEYTDSFLSFFPTMSVITNIELDHVDYFGTLERVIESFSRYISLSDVAVINADDVNIARALEGVQLSQLVTFGLHAGEYRAAGIAHSVCGTQFEIIRDGSTLAQIRLLVHGDHNVYDALAAFAAAHTLGISPEVIAESLAHFEGPRRRFEYMGECHGAKVFDDYAHHPSEIAATIAGARELAPKKLTVVFQPHTYSRTAALRESIASALSAADEVILADIYAARETNEYGISSESVAQLIPGARCIHYFEAIAEYLGSTAGEDEIIIVMGAGDICKLEKLILDRA